MYRPLAIRLLAHAQTAGAKEELIGDLLEEMFEGRSQMWMWRQLAALYGFAAAARIRRRARVRPWMITLALCVVLLAGAEIGSAGGTLVAWLVFYYVAGTASLFAHMAASSATSARMAFDDR